MSSELRSTLRRLKPQKWETRLTPRPEAELEFIETVHDRPRKLLYDTTVYVDILQSRFSQSGDAMLRASEAWHSTVTEAELTAAVSLLDPAHPDTRLVIEQIVSVVERRPIHRTITPDSQIWREAGILSGLLARLQQYGRDQRRQTLNDALVFASARKYGCTVLTRNAVDFDFLQQLDPSGRVLFYK